MKYSHVPRYQNVIAFLKSKGWTVDESKTPYFVMTPPVEMRKKFSGDFQLYLAAYDPGDNPEVKKMYARQIWNNVETVAGIYHFDPEELCRWFSEPVEYFNPRNALPQATAAAA